MDSYIKTESYKNKTSLSNKAKADFKATPSDVNSAEEDMNHIKQEAAHSISSRHKAAEEEIRKAVSNIFSNSDTPKDKGNNNNHKIDNMLENLKNL